MKHRATLLCLILLGGGALAPLAGAGADTYQDEIRAWQQQRLKNLKTPDGWLSLCGLFWLQPGPNTLGAAADNTMALKSAHAPAHIGTFTLAKGLVRFKPHQDALSVAPDLKADADMVLNNDASARPTVLKFGAISCVLITRGDRLGLRVRDAEHPRIQELQRIDTFPVDPAWRVAAMLKRYATPVMLKTQTIIGTTEEVPCPGVLEFTIAGKICRLFPQGASADLFIVFGDATNGSETYGNGRFLSVKKPDDQGRTVIDFNMAYNPPCAFSPYATCPLPPAGNTLSLAVTAGEKRIPGTGH